MKVREIQDLITLAKRQEKELEAKDKLIANKNQVYEAMKKEFSLIMAEKDKVITELKSEIEVDDRNVNDLMDQVDALGKAFEAIALAWNDLDDAFRFDEDLTNLGRTIRDFPH